MFRNRLLPLALAAACCGVLCAADPLHADDEPPVDPPVRTQERPSPAPEAERVSEERPAPADDADEQPVPTRDPFETTDMMRTAAEKERTGERFVPAEKLDMLPEMKLRGFVEDATGKTLALLQIERGDTYLVRKDDTISIRLRNRNVVLKVVDVTQLRAVVEVGELRRAIVVR